MKIQQLIQRPLFWIALVILLHILLGIITYCYRPRTDMVKPKRKREFVPLNMQKIQRVQPPKGNSLTNTATHTQAQGPQRPPTMNQQSQSKPTLPAPHRDGSSEPMQQSTAPTEAPQEQKQPDQTIKRDKGRPTPKKRIQAPKRAKRKTVNYYPDTPQPSKEPSPLAAIAQGFIGYQQNQQAQKSIGTADGSKFGDLKHMKYVSYWKRFQQHFNASWRIIQTELPQTEAMRLSGRADYKNVTYNLEWDTTGALVHSVQVESSGNDIFDAAVARLIREATPVPAIPPSFNVNTMSINFTIGPGVMHDMIPGSFGYT